MAKKKKATKDNSQNTKSKTEIPKTEEKESSAPSSIQTVETLTGRSGKHPVRHNTINNRGFGYNP